MQGATIRAGAHYRCTARRMVPGSALLRDHPKTVNLREEPVVEALNGWIGQLFDRTNINATVARCSLRKQASESRVGATWPSGGCWMPSPGYVDFRTRLQPKSTRRRRLSTR